MRLGTLGMTFSGNFEKFFITVGTPVNGYFYHLATFFYDLFSEYSIIYFFLLK